MLIIPALTKSFKTVGGSVFRPDDICANLSLLAASLTILTAG